MTSSLPILHLSPKQLKVNENSINISPKLFKPLPIKINKNDINLKFPVSTKINDSKMPLIYPQFQYGSISNLNFNSSTHLQNMIFYEKNNNKCKKVLDIKTKPCCSCIKTKCIKKYCECFSTNKSCTNCLCFDCRNKDIYMVGQNKDNSTNNTIKEMVFCTCSKSGCNKKYCECYKEGIKCNIKCRCVNCSNVEENSDKNNDYEKIIALDETRCESGKKSICDELTEFNIEKISVLIGKTQTFINTEKLTEKEFVLLCKKRKME